LAFGFHEPLEKEIAGHPGAVRKDETGEARG